MPAYIGFDPGPSTGITVLLSMPRGDWEVHAFQCTAVSVPFLLGELIEYFEPVCVAGEEFVASNRAGGKGKKAEDTRRAYHQAREIAARKGVPFASHRATDVMGWASEKRLERIGFPLGPKFRDARASAKHALYTAVRYYGAKDPLA